jgi:DivIVA domain-containing protein
VNGRQVRGTQFFPAGATAVPGYDAEQVDVLLRCVAAELDAGGSVRHLIQNATFRKGTYRRNYDIDAVDWFLDQFLLSPDQYEPGGIAEDPWGDLPVTQLARERPSKFSYAYQGESLSRDFDQMPGTHLRFGKAASGLSELRTEEQQTLASVWGLRSKTFSAGGRSFILRRTSSAESSSPAVADFRARVTRDESGRHEEKTRIQAILAKTVLANLFVSDIRLRGLADETGTPILYTAGQNFHWRASACILLPDQRRLRFLVWGTDRENAIMTAVDQARNKIAQYRLTDKSGRPKKSWRRGSVEIIVHPGQKLTDEVALTLALSADWLRSYFDKPNDTA